MFGTVYSHAFRGGFLSGGQTLLVLTSGAAIVWIRFMFMWGNQSEPAPLPPTDLTHLTHLLKNSLIVYQTKGWIEEAVWRVTGGGWRVTGDGGGWRVTCVSLQRAGRAWRGSWKCLMLGLHHLALAYTTPLTAPATCFIPQFQPRRGWERCHSNALNRTAGLWGPSLWRGWRASGILMLSLL